MGFKNQITKVDFGSITIENIFINDFMCSANGTYVKVYLLGYKYAVDNDENIDFNNSSIAKHLNIPLEDVLNAWDFWQKKGIIKKSNIDDSVNYDVEFISLRQLYIDNNYKVNNNEVSYERKTSNSDLIEINKSPEIKNMFYKIDQFMRRNLSPNERLEVLNFLLDNNVDPDVVTMAFEYSIETKNVKNIKYALKVLNAWVDNGLITVDLIENNLKQSNKYYRAYRAIYKSLGYSNLITSGDKEIIDIWLQKYDLSLEFILEVIKESSKKTSNVNMNYMHSIVKNLYKNKINTIEGFKTFKTTHTNTKKSYSNSKTAPSKTKFHNFEKSKSNYSNEDIEKILGIKK
ncbi:DnaD domain-containing protein [Helicovermis profundi]|uniref:DnaD domain protein n=1 Tax=Helicovermis profundi TaxID=3065157 RepID=A0AAU9EA51_9FIRM|nr:DnaD domain protein [Clostridia bacterium S502]